MRRKPFIFVVLAILVVGVVNLSGVAVLAQDKELPDADDGSSGAFQDHYPDVDGPRRSPEGVWFMPVDSASAQGDGPLSSQTTGGPDGFGYVWDDAVALNWIDATVGVDTGMSGSSSGQGVGPIILPFTFKYYENSYDSLYIAASGYLAFTYEGYWPWQPRVPSPAIPNNIVAPYATPLDLAATGSTGRVYYVSGGLAPNRYFVVEWFQVGHDGEFYTFEVILYENGDIVFQYQTMAYDNDGYACGAAGIEDLTGLDGLGYVDFCDQAPSNKAVHFYRPPASARTQIRPPYQGTFTVSDSLLSYRLVIRNNGEYGSDTYDLTTYSSWPITLYDTSGTALTDTDGDGTIDTGIIAQGTEKSIFAKVQTPAETYLGDSTFATVTAISSLDSSKSKTATLQAAVPAPFVQAFRDGVDDAMSLYLAQPSKQSVRKATGDDYFGSDLAVAETPGFVYAWTSSAWTGNYGIRNIEYTLHDDDGFITRPVNKLTDNSGAMLNTYDYDPAVAVAPNGNIGIVWYRYLWDRNTGFANYNIWFAILNSSGDIIYGPANLTNDTVWGYWDDIGFSEWYEPRIAATDDNHFVLAWQHYMNEIAGGLSDIYYTVRDSYGAEIRPVAKYTNGIAGTDYYDTPALTALSGNNVLLVYEGPNCFSYVVLNSVGSTVKAEETTNRCGGMVDAAQFLSGNAIVAWSGYGGIEYIVLDGGYNIIAGPTMLYNPAAITGDEYVSVTVDKAGHAILTWLDDDSGYRRHLYYALIDSSGGVLTEPMIFYMAKTSASGEQYVYTSYEGYGNTTYSATPNVEAVEPGSGLNETPVTVFIEGTNFSPGMSAALSDGNTTILLEGLLSIDTTHLQGTIPVYTAPGTYDLVLSDTYGRSGTLPNAYVSLGLEESDDLFTLDESDLWSTPPSIEAGETVTLGLTVRRQGGVADLVGVVVDFYRDSLGGTLIGSGIAASIAPTSTATVSVPWTAPLAGQYTLYAVIDPDNNVPEYREDNNVVSRDLKVIPAAAAVPPAAESFTINEGAVYTGDRQVYLDVSVVADTAIPARLLFVEYQYIQSQHDWIPVAMSGWLPYNGGSSSYSWKLQPAAGVHHLQVWLADENGLISTEPGEAFINYIPPTMHVAMQEVHIYQYALLTGESLLARLTPTMGDADLYVWAPDGGFKRSETDGTVVEQIQYDANVDGVYQVEAEGYTSADYGLDVSLSGKTVFSYLDILKPIVRGRGRPLSVTLPDQNIGLPDIKSKIYLSLVVK